MSLKHRVIMIGAATGVGGSTIAVVLACWLGIAPGASIGMAWRCSGYFQAAKVVMTTETHHAPPSNQGNRAAGPTANCRHETTANTHKPAIVGM